MHALSVLSVCRAAKVLSENRNERITIRAGEKVIEIVDDNGDILHYDTDAPTLCKRMRSRAELSNLAELLM